MGSLRQLNKRPECFGSFKRPPSLGRTDCANCSKSAMCWEKAWEKVKSLHAAKQLKKLDVDKVFSFLKKQK